MGAANSRVEEDKALQICRERKKFVRQALDGRCSLAATHVAYIEALKITGIALRKFVEPEAPIESSIYTSTSATPELFALTERSLSQFSFSSVSKAHNVDLGENVLPSPPPYVTSHVNHMKFGGTFSRKVEEKPAVPVTVSVTSGTPQNSTPGRHEEASPFDTPVSYETPPWDFFGLGQASDGHLYSQEGRTENREEDDGVPLSEDERHNNSSPGRDSSRQESDDEFDDPSAETLVQRFVNVNNRTKDHISSKESPAMSADEAVTSELKTPNLSPLKPALSGVAVAHDVKTPVKEYDVENKVAPKDFFSSMKDIEQLFMKASESGREVPQMLEANKINFRPIVPGARRGSIAKTLLTSCFACGKDPSQVPEEPEPPQTSPKYLTWHRTSSISSSSRNLLGVNSTDNIDDSSTNLFDNFCMNSGSHASTLDRLHAWEKKLYDEVKACEILRSEYDAKRKLLRQLESSGQSQHKIDRIRAVMKDLHSRIGVAIHRINSISRKIEELRDEELQPQLEELIEGLRKMWEEMLNCHEIQLHILSIAHSPGNMKLSMNNSESRRQITIHLENELISLSSSFTKWIGAQKTYVEAINKWLLKCVSLKEQSSRRKRRPPQQPLLRYYGPPIYMICGVWLDMFTALPTKEVTDAMKDLAAEITHFLPRQEKTKGKGVRHPRSRDWQSGANSDLGIPPPLRDEALEDWVMGYDHFRTSMAVFLGKLNNFAESSVKKFAELQNSTEKAKKSYAQVRSTEQ
nr:nitrate regulatory gene2 protein [Ipomoea batatas]